MATVNKHNNETDAKAITFMGEEYPEYMRGIIEAIERGEAPKHEQLEYAYEKFVEHITNPLRQMDQDQHELWLRARSVAERMIELAPEFFDRALRRHPRETAYFIEKNTEEKDND